MKNFILIAVVLLIFSLKSFAQNIDHWESMVLAEEVWKYRIGDSEPPNNWYTENFNDNNWLEGNGGFGYDDGDDNTIIAPAHSIYLRKDFEIIDLAHLETLIFHADFDDAFVAYLNGVEIARSNNIEGDFPAFDATLSIDREAQLYQGGLPIPFSFDKIKINQCLQNGSNTLAIQVNNTSINSSDMSALFFLTAGINIATTNYSPTPDWFFVPFSSSDLPILKINTFGNQIPDDPKIVAHLGIIDNGAGNRNNVFTDSLNGYDGQISIEIRGASSQSFPKKNYGFETQDSLGENNNVKLLGMPKENDWILHGPFSDKSFMRNVLAYHLGNQLGSWAPRTRFCELFINGDYQGIYVLTEKIKIDKNRVDIAKLDLDDNAGDSLTGGYIVQVDREEFGNGWYSTFFPFHFFVYQNPNSSDLTFQQELYIRNYITSFEQATTNGNFADPVNGYAQYIDVGSFIDHMLVVELARDVDAYRLSSFLFKDKDSKGGKLNAGPLWDFNLAFGNADYGEGWFTSGWNFETPGGDQSQPFWWDRLLEDPNYRNKMTCRWEEMREGAWQTDSILQFIDEQAATLEEAQERNFERWNVLGNYVWPNFFVGDTYAEEINYLKEWTTARLTWMDENMVGTCETVGTEFLENEFQVTVQPNPFSENVDFIFSKNISDANLELRIFDALGQEVQVLNFEQKNKLRWNGKDKTGKSVAAGIYFYVFSDGNTQVGNGKIMKF